MKNCFPVVLLFLLCLPTQAQERSIEAFRLQDGQRVELDGSLDEPFWQSIEPATDFLQQAPIEGAASSERSEVRIAYDDQVLYIGATLYDSDPNGILGYQKQRDASLASDDRFMWILDTFRDGRTGYFFEINPAGLMGDGLLGSISGVNKSWDGIWEARVTQGDFGWSAEIRIPFRTLNFDPINDTWGINFQRTVRRTNEETLWSGHLRNQSLFEPIFAGSVSGLKDMSQGIGLEVKPYGITTATSIREEDGGFDRTQNLDGGFDITYSITPSLRGAVSVNTDFAEVEVDQRRVNLTRFPLFFPERRDFFLEGSRVFDFAPRNGANPYFSRRIGLESGRQIPITYGTRLAGQEGAFDIGLLHVRTAKTNNLPAENFTVGRVKRNFGEQSSVGFIFTRRGSNDFEGAAFAPDRYTLGGDLEYTTSKLFGDRNFNFQAFWVWHNENTFDENSSDLDRSVRGLRFRYDNEPIIFQTSYREFGAYYNPAVGFNSRNSYKRVEPQVLFEPRLTKSALIRELSFRVAYENIWDLNNRVLTQGVDFRSGIMFESGDNLFFSVERASEVLEFNFNIYENLIIEANDYDFTEWTAFFSTASRRTISAFGILSYGDFWTGDRTQIDLGLTIRPVPGISLTSNWEQNQVDLVQGSFTTNLYRFTGAWQFSPWTSTTAILQYDDVTELLTLFSRFRWTLRPGNDIFFIFSRNWENEFANINPERFMLRAFETGASLKVNYTHRF